MAKPFLPKRNTTAKNDEFTGKPYEVTLDCERQELRIHDGVNAGGFPVARAADLKQSTRVSHTQYQVGDVVACPKRAGVYLVCETAGQTLNGDIDFSGASVGSHVNDGTVRWLVKQPSVTSVNGTVGDEFGAVVIDTGVLTINGNAPINGNIEPSQVGCLPLSGGTMTGEIIASSGYFARQHTDGGALIIRGGTDSTSSNIVLYGKNHSSNAGWFALQANNGTTNKYLVGKPDGSLTWANKNVVCSVNNTSADANGNVEVDAMPELSALPYTDKAEIQDGETYEYEMKDDGFVTLTCVAGTGQRYYSGGGGDAEDFWEEYRDEGNTTLRVVVNDLEVYPSLTTKGSQPYSDRFFLKKGRKISVYCKRSYKYNVIPHSFSIKVLPHA